MQYLRRRLCFVVVVLGSPLAGTGRGALGLTEPQNRPVKGGLLAGWLAGWSSHRENVAFSVNHNADSFLPDCIGGSRDLP